MVALAKRRRVGVTTMRDVLHQRKIGPVRANHRPRSTPLRQPWRGSRASLPPEAPTRGKRRFGRDADIPLRRRRSQMSSRQPPQPSAHKNAQTAQFDRSRPRCRRCSFKPSTSIRGRQRLHSDWPGPGIRSRCGARRRGHWDDAPCRPAGSTLPPSAGKRTKAPRCRSGSICRTWFSLHQWERGTDEA